MTERGGFKVLVIALNREREPYPVYPLGAAVIARALEDDGVAVRGLDCAFLDDPAGAASESARAIEPDLIAMSIRAVDNTCLLDTRFYIPEAAAVASAVRASSPAPLLIGGSGFSLFPRRILDELGADYGIVGEGEAAVVDLVRALRAGADPAGVAGVVSRSRRAAPATATMLEAERWPPPSYRAFPIEPHLRAGSVASIQTKRGCAVGCSYCTYPMLEGRSYRLRDGSDIAREVASLADREVRDLFFVDSIFNLPRAHARSVCIALRALARPARWSAFLSPIGFDGELADLMADAGARAIEMGSEAGAAATLQGLGKHHTPADISSADRACVAAGLVPAHYFLFGGPGETEESLERSLGLIDTLQGPVAAMFGIRLYPGTELCRRAVEESVVAPDRDLFQPTFYLSPRVDRNRMLMRLREYAAGRRNFLLLGGDRSEDRALQQRLRNRGRKGALWEYLPR